jgi:hypothetical protein
MPGWLASVAWVVGGRFGIPPSAAIEMPLAMVLQFMHCSLVENGADVVPSRGGSVPVSVRAKLETLRQSAAMEDLT